VLLGVGVPVGCYVVLSDGGASPTTVGKNASAKYAAVDGFTARMTVVREIGAGTNRSVYSVARRPGQRFYYRRALANDSRGADLVMVNRSTARSYDRADDTAERMDITGLNRLNDSLGDRLDPLFRKINAQRGVEDIETPTPGVAPVPVVPAGSAPTPAPDATNGSDGYDVTYLGTEQVAGRETHHVRVRENFFADDVTANFTREIWLDSEHFVPLQYEYVRRNDGQRNRVRVRYANVSFDSVPGHRFRFDPEGDVSAADPTILRRQTYESRAALVDASATTVPNPSIPDRFGFDYGTYQDSGPRELTLRYHNDSAFAVVVKSERPEVSFPAEPGEVSLGNRTARYADYGPDGRNRLLAWECDGYEYVVATRKVTREQHSDIARSVGCGWTSEEVSANPAGQERLYSE
jgi:outer membrane lipoprotein-sorting protein